MKNHARPPRATIATTVAGLTAALGVTAFAATAPPGAAPRASTAAVTTAAAAPVPVLNWTSCDSGFQCATARVPLDYRRPDGTKISIAVIRHLATDPARRIGSLFVNGGGPSEQIEGFLADYQGLPAIVRERYDVIDFDPRGFGFSTALRCFPSAAAEQKFLGALPPFPVGAKQDATWERTYAEFDALCATKHNRGLLDHDTSADTARDMNVLRQAVGDPVLNYLGISYGTGIGAIYANLFPGKVGRMVLDASTNPVAWTTPDGDGSLPALLRLDSDEANAADMAAFLTMCGQATTTACPFSAGTPAATKAKWNTLLNRLRRHQVTTGNPPQTYTYADAITSVPLDTIASWQQGAGLLQQLWLASAGNTSATATGTVPTAHTPTAYTGLEQQLAVLCTDSPNPGNPSTYAADAKLAYARSGGFGLDWLWNNEPCAQWPGHGTADRYTGPWNRRTASAILLLANTGDAALPYQDSLAMEHDLARARLLTIKGYGHTQAEQGFPSTCALNYTLSYLQTGALPKAGTVCQDDTPPFPAP